MVRLDLPWDLVEEILSRVPATSLTTRLRFTCKRWNALFKDHKFITKHMDKARKQNFILVLSNFRVYSLSTNLKKIHKNIAFHPLMPQLSPQVKITKVFHCNGLLLCSTEECKLVVVNPCTGQARWITSEIDYCFYDSYALGYANNNNKSYDSYKILMFSNDCKNFGIFEIKSNSWRVLANIPPNMELFPPNMEIFFNDRSVSLKGNTYWHSHLNSYILSFDFTTETLRRVCLPVLSQNQNSRGYTSDLSVVREEKLSVLRWSHGMRQMEIWVSDKIGTETVLSWSKSFAFDFFSRHVLRSLSSMGVFIQEEKKVIVVGSCSSEEKYKDKIYIVDKHGCRKLCYDTEYSNICRPFLFSYVPSLVSLYPPM